MSFIADEKILFESPDPKNVYCYTPALCHGFNGRILASFDLGGARAAGLEGPCTVDGDTGGNQLRVLCSDDRGATWRETVRLAMLHALLFKAGNAVYLFGSDPRLVVSRSLDNGETWSAPVVLDDSVRWEQSGCRVDFRHGKIYLAYEQHLPERSWPSVAPVLFSAREDDDLCRRESWRMSAPFDPRELIGHTDNLGVPFFPEGDLLPGNKVDARYNGFPGIVETNVVRLYDPGHLFFDPADRTVLLMMRAHTGTTNLAAVLKGLEAPDGTLRIEPLRTPAGATMFYLPFPGGQMKFAIEFDPVSRLYWLVSTQSTDSMTRPELLTAERFNIPNNERRRLQLSFSKNGFDWCHAGMIAIGAVEKASRHYAGLLIDGDDLLILSRSGDARAATAHCGNLLTLHRVRDFRRLVY